MKKVGSDIVIDMKPNSKGVFEGGRVRKVKDKSAQKDVRPGTLKKSRPAEKVNARTRVSRGRKQEPVESTVLNPVRELQEGVQAGLDLLSGVSSVMRLFK